MELAFFSYSDIWSRILEVVPKLRQYGITAVTYVPRGGCFPASIIANILEVPLLSPDCAVRHALSRVLVVEDIVVTGRTLADFKRCHFQDSDIVTYTFAEVPHLREIDCKIDIVSMVIDKRTYLMLPWELVDMFEPTFPFQPLFDLDGILRTTPRIGKPLLSIPHRIRYLVSFETEYVRDREWLHNYGYQFEQLIFLPGTDGITKLVSYMKKHHIDIYVGSDTTRCTTVKQLYPECHVISFREIKEL